MSTCTTAGLRSAAATTGSYERGSLSSLSFTVFTSTSARRSRGNKGPCARNLKRSSARPRRRVFDAACSVSKSASHSEPILPQADLSIEHAAKELPEMGYERPPAEIVEGVASGLGVKHHLLGHYQAALQREDAARIRRRAAVCAPGHVSVTL